MAAFAPFSGDTADSLRIERFPILFVSVLALLVCNPAAGLAGRLARGLALAAAAVGSALAEITGLNRKNVFHFALH